MSEPLYCRICSAAGNVKLFYCSTCKTAECEDCRGSSRCRFCSDRSESIRAQALRDLEKEKKRKKRKIIKIQTEMENELTNAKRWCILSTPVGIGFILSMAFYPNYLNPYGICFGSLFIAPPIITGIRWFWAKTAYKEFLKTISEKGEEYAYDVYGSYL